MPDSLRVAQQLRQAAQALQQGLRPENLPALLLRAAEIIQPQQLGLQLAQPDDDVMPEADLVLEADGGSRGNPGPAGAGAVLRQADGRVIKELYRFLGCATNNVAEYQALIMGLQAASECRPRTLGVKLDSELLVRQLQGRYQVKSPHLKPLHQQALNLLAGFKQVQVTHIPREQNHLADALANRAMDEGK